MGVTMRREKPCDNQEILKKLPCVGSEEKPMCYGIPFFEKRAANDGEIKKIESLSECPKLFECRKWWKDNILEK